MAEHNILGHKGEMLAARYLMEQGFAVLEYNWRSGKKEIDIIAKERNVLVFVEVKTRSTDAYGDAVEAVTPDKISNIISAANSYLKMKKLDTEVRFDVVTLVGNIGNCRIEHIRDAFYPLLS
ncbi:MAG: YraN family protein [Bacteroidaceae bacterium]|nr:YraN family protein [Bacteroidaceae bacterium]